MERLLFSAKVFPQAEHGKSLIFKCTTRKCFRADDESPNVLWHTSHAIVGDADVAVEVVVVVVVAVVAEREGFLIVLMMGDWGFRRFLVMSFCTTSCDDVDDADDEVVVVVSDDVVDEVVDFGTAVVGVDVDRRVVAAFRRWCKGRADDGAACACSLLSRKEILDLEEFMIGVCWSWNELEVELADGGLSRRRESSREGRRWEGEDG